MTRAATGIYRGATAEERRAQRRRRLMDAALELIGTQGWAQTTLRGVCERARVGPRFFYESFADLDELAAAVHAELVDDALQKTLRAVREAPDDLAAKSHAGVATIIRAFTDDPRRARFVFAEAHASETLMRLRFRAMRTIADVVAEQAATLLDMPPDSEVVRQAFALLFTGGVAEMILVWLDGGLDLDRDGLIDLCHEFLLTSARTLPDLAARVSRR
ncbi:MULTISPECIES: TetR/AcrR family transcriptional regulator [Thermocrispum]|uniref:TetR/AcrR family transcriptional regulator n=1 Tax=Thermocrispum agreste TaxID=37925 RepID=A0A2W4JDD5_9PSEU|nr:MULTISPECIES: TetR/AcrR family transcriptional regulator [Thermocrispum]PZM96088.1 MAG: TetR/AcrR family transcriptional regulator [Thermocrispum agreste]